MNHPKIRPLDKKILVLPIIEKVSETIEILHGKEAQAMQRPVYGEVIRVGPDCNEVKEGDTIMMPTEPGKVLFAKQFEDRRYVFVHENTVAGIVIED